MAFFDVVVEAVTDFFLSIFLLADWSRRCSRVFLPDNDDDDDDNVAERAFASLSASRFSQVVDWFNAHNTYQNNTYNKHDDDDDDNDLYSPPRAHC